MHDSFSDVRYAIRALAKNPAFSLAVVGVLTLGIGLNAAVFTMLKGIALSPLAGVEDRRGSASSSEKPAPDVTSPCRIPIINTSAITTRRSRDCSAATSARSRWAEAAAPRPVFAEIVTGNYFQVLGVRAARPHAAAVGRGRAEPPAGGGDQRQSVAARLRRRSGHRRQDARDQQRRADRRGCVGSGVPRDDRELRRRAVHPGDDGAATRLQVRKPGEHAGGDPRRSARRASCISTAVCVRGRRSPTRSRRPMRRGPRWRAIDR